MNEILRPQALAGSITPQLEGAAQSKIHPQRTSAQSNIKPGKGGAEHE